MRMMDTQVIVNGARLRMEQTGFAAGQKQARDGSAYGWRQFLDNLERIMAKVD